MKALDIIRQAELEAERDEERRLFDKFEVTRTHSNSSARHRLPTPHAEGNIGGVRFVRNFKPEWTGQ